MTIKSDEDGSTCSSSNAVLFVDDDPDMLETLRLNFDHVFEALFVSSGREALDLMDARWIAVLVVDQRMPDMSGLDLTVEARRRNPDVVPILLSGYPDSTTLLTAIDVGVRRFVTKPWDSDELESTIRGALRSTEHGRGSLAAQRAHAERGIITRSLVRRRGNKSAAARDLEITYRALVKVMRRLGMVGKR